jgi:Raf kinase inhibitor-like YbhB/YbcL family protein
MMMLRSSAFEPGQEMAQAYGKKVDNVSLPFSWSGAPEETKSFALILVDRDARDYVHWVVSSIPADITELVEDAAATSRLPAGAVEVKPYAGPFPPSGTHRYDAILVALSVERLEVPVKVDLGVFTDLTRPHAIATAQLTGTFTKRRG